MSEDRPEASEGERFWSLILLAKEEGFRLNNLCELEPNWWRANLNKGATLWEFGEGSTPSAALVEAIKAARASTGTPAIQGSNTPEMEKPARPRRTKSSAMQSILDLDLEL